MDSIFQQKVKLTAYKSTVIGELNQELITIASLLKKPQEQTMYYYENQYQKALHEGLTSLRVLQKFVQLFGELVHDNLNRI